MRLVLAYLSQSGLRGALAGLLVGGLLGMVGAAAALPAGRPCGPRPRSPGAGGAVGGLFLGLAGGGLGGLIGLGLALRRRWVPPARLSGLFLTAAVAVLPPGGVLSAGWLPLTRGWGLPRVRAAALLALLAGGLLAVRLRRPIDRLLVALGPGEGRLVWGGRARAGPGHGRVARAGRPGAAAGLDRVAPDCRPAGDGWRAGAGSGPAGRRGRTAPRPADHGGYTLARSSVPPGAARIVQEGWPPVHGSAIPVATPRAPAMHWPRPD